MDNAEEVTHGLDPPEACGLLASRSPCSRLQAGLTYPLGTIDTVHGAIILPGAHENVLQSEGKMNA